MNTVQKMAELKPSPFCAGPCRTYSHDNVPEVRGITFIACDDCGARFSFYGRERKDKTISAFNSRAGDKT